MLPITRVCNRKVPVNNDRNHVMILPWTRIRVKLPIHDRHQNHTSGRNRQAKANLGPVHGCFQEIRAPQIVIPVRGMSDCPEFSVYL